jgi:hypothetical protein
VWIRTLRHTNMINTNSGFCEHENRISGHKIVRRNSFMPEKAQVTQQGRCSMKLVAQVATDSLWCHKTFALLCCLLQKYGYFTYEVYVDFRCTMRFFCVRALW